jgi:hypothetical protein
MSTIIFIDPNIPNYDNLKKKIIVDSYTFNYPYPNHQVNRIGFLWENNSIKIPFGSTPFVLNNSNKKKNITTKISNYFNKELIVYLKQIKTNIIVDLITFNLI